MSYVKPVSALVLSVAAGLCAVACAEEPAPKEGTRIIILDGKRVRVDDKMNVIERLDEGEPAKKEETKESKKEEKKEKKAKKEAKEEKKEEKEEKKEAKKEKKEEKEKSESVSFAAAPGDSAAPTANPFAAEEAKEKAARETREQAQALVEQDVKMRAAVKKLASPGWRDAQITLISSGKTSVPYLIEAMGEITEGTPAAAYNLGGHTKSDTGRASRQRALSDVACEVLTEMVKNHSDFKGEIPACDQHGWQIWWTANGEAVKFGK